MGDEGTTGGATGGGGEASDLPAQFGRYSVERFIAGGGMGQVFRAHDPRLDRRVAIKTLTAAGLADQTLAIRFRQEGRAAARLNHPNIVHVYDVGIEGDTAYLVLEYVPGGSLHDRVEHHGPFDFAAWSQLARELLSATEAVHAANIVHRDIKPRNIFLTLQGAMKLGDFGIAHLETDLGLTRTGDVVGTVAYMAPECREGMKATLRADLFSVGRTLAFAASGATLPPSVLPGYPPETRRWLDRMVATDPVERFACVEDAAAALAGFCAPEPTARPTISWALPVLLLVVGLAVGWWLRPDAAEPLATAEPTPAAVEPTPAAVEPTPETVVEPLSAEPTPAIASTPAPTPLATAAPERATPTPAVEAASPDAPVVATVSAIARHRAVAEGPFVIRVEADAPPGYEPVAWIRQQGAEWTSHPMGRDDDGWTVTFLMDGEWLGLTPWYVELRDPAGRVVATDGSRSQPRLLEAL